MNAHGCELGDQCGTRCGTCDDRITCMGPTPAANACAAHDNECQDCNDDNRCRLCAMTRRNAHIWATADQGPRPAWDPATEAAEAIAEQRRDERRWIA